MSARPSGCSTRGRTRSGRSGRVRTGRSGADGRAACRPRLEVFAPDEYNVQQGFRVVAAGWIITLPNRSRRRLMRNPSSGLIAAVGVAVCALVFAGCIVTATVDRGNGHRSRRRSAARGRPGSARSRRIHDGDRQSLLADDARHEMDLPRGRRRRRGVDGDSGGDIGRRGRLRTGSLLAWCATRCSGRGEIIEDTFDWYAQDAEGAIWYLGEDTAEFENGQIASREGSFEAGVDGALPGIPIPARPEPGMSVSPGVLRRRGGGQRRGSQYACDGRIPLTGTSPTSCSPGTPTVWSQRWRS